MDLDEFVGLVRRSPVLEALREGPLDRRDLQERLGVSRPTIHRHVRHLDGADLIEKGDGEFMLTPLGDIVAEEFTRLFRVMDSVSSLREVFQWLPIEAFDFDLRRLGDAEVTVPSRTDPAAPSNRAAAIVDRADRIRLIAYQQDLITARAVKRNVVEDDGSFEGVFDPVLVETAVATERGQEFFRALLEHESTVAVHPRRVPFTMGIADETVVVNVVDDRNRLQAAIVSEDSVVRDWAERTIDTCLSGAEPFDFDVLGTREALAQD